MDSIDAAAYWLLQSVVTHRLPIARLLPEPGEPEDLHFSVLFNRESHGLNCGELQDRLDALLARDLLRTWPPGCDAFARSDDGFSPTSSQVRTALAIVWSPRSGEAEPAERLHFGLSPAGGRFWESLTHPDWNQFVLHEEAYGPSPNEAFALRNDDGIPQSAEPLNVRLESTNRALIASLVHQDQETYRIVDSASIQWSQQRAWDATYWKRFPVAYRVEYHLLPEEELRARGAAITQYEDLSRFPERWGPFWYTDYITRRPSR